MTCYNPDWLRKLVRPYNGRGPQAVGDGRHDDPGQERLLSAAQEAELKEELEQASAAGQAWSSVQVAAWVSQKLGRAVRQADMR